MRDGLVGTAQIPVEHIRLGGLRNSRNADCARRGPSVDLTVTARDRTAPGDWWRRTPAVRLPLGGARFGVGPGAAPTGGPPADAAAAAAAGAAALAGPGRRAGLGERRDRSPGA